MHCKLELTSAQRQGQGLGMGEGNLLHSTHASVCDLRLKTDRRVCPCLTAPPASTSHAAAQAPANTETSSRHGYPNRAQCVRAGESGELTSRKRLEV